MARIRSIKPEMRRSLTVCAWPIPVRWTFVGLPGYVDDHGRGIDEVRLIKAELYPMDDNVSTRKISQHLEMIAKTGPLCRYLVDGRHYLHLTSWGEHQRVSHPAASVIPPCPHHEGPGDPPDPLPTDSGDPPEPLANESGGAPERLRASRVPAEQGTGKGTGKGVPATPAAASTATTQGALLETPDEPPPVTVNTQAQTLARHYVELVPLSKFTAVMGIAKQALNAKYESPAITAALTRIAGEGRPLTVDVLRVELEGMPPPRGRGPASAVRFNPADQDYSNVQL